MQMLEMLYDEIQDAVDRKVPFVISIGTMEYHARHASCGTDTLVVTGCLRELEKEKEIVVCPSIWHLAPLPATKEQLTAMIILPECTYANDCTVVDLSTEEQFEIIL